MDVTARGKVNYLELDRLTTNPILAQRLPAELAFQYHALPVAEREGRLTIAMANPEDGVARAAICQALGTAPYLVKGDARVIDRLLSKMWSEPQPRPLHLLAFDPPSEEAGELVAYAGALSEHLGAVLERDSVLNLNQSGCDLVIMNKTEPSSFWQVMAGLKETQSANQPPASLLAVQKPVWPLTKLLLVIRCNEPGDTALNWIIKVAKPTRLAVTLQIVTPFLPTTFYDDYIRALMSTNTEVGNWYRSVRRQFEQCQIPSAVKIRQGEPDWQLKRELAENEYDLAVIAYKRTSMFKQWLLRDELVCSLLDHAGCPVLIAQ